MTFELPWPPALNRYYRNVNGRTILSRDGRTYRINAHAALADQQIRGVPGKVACHISAHQPDRRRRDLDGMLKAALDALESNGVIDNDADIDDLRITRASVDKANPRLVITVEPL